MAAAGSPDKTVFFYDGDCGFCHRTVQFLLRRSRPGALYFSKLQSPYAQGIFDDAKLGPPDLLSAYLLEDGTMHKASEAILRSLAKCRLPWNVLSASRLVPVFIRDAVYFAIARRRKHISQLTTCPVPAPADLDRFIE